MARREGQLEGLTAEAARQAEVAHAALADSQGHVERLEGLAVALREGIGGGGNTVADLGRGTARELVTRFHELRGQLESAQVRLLAAGGPAAVSLLPGGAHTVADAQGSVDDCSCRATHTHATPTPAVHCPQQWHVTVAEERARDLQQHLAVLKANSERLSASMRALEVRARARCGVEATGLLSVRLFLHHRMLCGSPSPPLSCRAPRPSRPGRRMPP
jgi:hypothetical protein